MQVVTPTIETVEISREELSRLQLMDRTVAHMRGYVMIVEHTRTEPPYIIKYVNNAFTQLTGYEPAEVCGKNPMLVLLGPESDVDLLRSKLADVEEGHAAVFDLLHYRKDGQCVELDTSIFPLLGEEDVVQYTISIGREISERRRAEIASLRAKLAEESNEILRKEIAERKEAESQLARAAFHDALTALPNRILFANRTTAALARERQNHNGSVAVLFVDCDNLKTVNDTLGHSVGDEYLVAVARRLEECTRPGDIVARIGGDEFTMLLESIDDMAAASDIAERVSRTVSKRPFQVAEHKIAGTVSIGIALSSPSCQTPEDLLRDADIAMYRAKVLGKNRCQTFAIAMRDQVARAVKIQEMMRSAVERGGLTVAYQPIVSLENGRIEGFEALARLYDRELGEISPVEFIPVAEETGLIVPLGLMLLHKACAQASGWRRTFPNRPDLSINVNVSVRQLMQSDFEVRVAEVLRSTDLPAENLNLEITESMFMQRRDRIGVTLTRLHKLGVRLSIDDFGTGFSSLAHLSEFPIDVLKIDRSFVSTGKEGGIVCLEIVRTVLSLARHLGLGVIAEGVENELQRNKLAAYGCHSAQGYFFGRPLKPETATEYLRRNFPAAKSREFVDELIADIPVRQAKAS